MVWPVAWWSTSWGPLLGELIDKMPPQRRMALSLVLAALFLIDGAYSSKHPNAGKGITDYDNWKQEEMTALPLNK
ncbi:MAG: hypothetical protein ACLUNZ_11800 [Evtepia sp.]